MIPTVIHTRPGIEAVVLTSRTTAPAIPLTTVTRWTASKQMGGDPVGRGQIVVRWDTRRWPPLDELITDDDWIFVRVRDVMGEWRPRVVFVDHVEESATYDPQSGTPSTEYTITWSDAGKPFAVHEFRTDPLLPAGYPGLVPLHDEVISLVEGTALYKPGDVMRKYLRTVFRPPRLRKKAPAAAPKSPAPAGPAAPPPPKPPPDDEQLTVNFRLSEFRSKGGYPFPADVKARLRTLAGVLQTLRDDYFKASVRIVCGYRSKQDNDKDSVKGAERSYHMRGLAADIAVGGMTPLQVTEAVKRAIADGAFPANYGLGLYGNMVHVDIGDGWGQPRPQMWIGDENKPSDADAASFLATRPQPGNPKAPATTAESDDSGEELEPTVYTVDIPELPEYETVEGGSADGAFRVPLGLAQRVAAASAKPGAEKGARWDWVDVMDDVQYVDAGENIQGRWWMLTSLYQLGKSKVHGFISEQADPAFNELWYETLPVRTKRSVLAAHLDGWAPCVVYRRRPFDKADWLALPAFEVDGRLISKASLSRGGAERFNYYLARPIGAGEAQGSVFDAYVTGGKGRIPAIELEDFYAHGQRSMEVEGKFIFPDMIYEDDKAEATEESPYFPPDPGDKKKKHRGFVERVAEATETLYRWHAPNPTFYGGTVTVPYVSAKHRIGSVCHLTRWVDGRPDRQGYVEGTQETIVWNPRTGAATASSTLTLTRVQPLSGYLAPVPPRWR